MTPQERQALRELIDVARGRPQAAEAIATLERMLDAPKAYPDRVCLDDEGLVDDVFFSGADVHIERMRHRGWWAGIYTAAGEVVHLNWYLEDVEGKKKKGLHLRVEGGPKPTPAKKEGRCST